MGPYLCTTGGGREELTQHISVHAIIFVDVIFLFCGICLTEEQRLRCRWYGGCVWALFAAAAVSPVGGLMCNDTAVSSPVGGFLCVQTLTVLVVQYVGHQ